MYHQTFLTFDINTHSIKLINNKQFDSSRYDALFTIKQSKPYDNWYYVIPNCVPDHFVTIDFKPKYQSLILQKNKNLSMYQVWAG